MVDTMRPLVFDLKQCYFNAMIFMAEKITYYYDIVDVPTEIQADFGYVIRKNRIAVINDHFDQ